MFANRVKNVVNRMAETKCVNYTINRFVVPGFNSNTFSGAIKCLNPCGSGTGGALYNIVHGTGQGAREGNVITTARARLRGVISINTAFDNVKNYNMCPLYVGMYIFRLAGSTVDTVSEAYNTCLTSYFQAGNTQQGFSGLLFDLTRDVNTSAVRLLKKRVFRVGTSTVLSGFAANSANNINQQYGDSQAQISQMFDIDITRLLHKKYIFNDNNQTPSQRNTYVMWVPFRVDGNQIVTNASAFNGTEPILVDFGVMYNYKDM